MRWWRIKWKDGAFANTMGSTKEDVLLKAHNYHKGEVESVEPLNLIKESTKEKFI